MSSRNHRKYRTKEPFASYVIADKTFFRERASIFNVRNQKAIRASISASPVMKTKKRQRSNQLVNHDCIDNYNTNNNAQ